MDVTDATFQNDVIERSHELPVVVDFWAEWCGPCRMLGPVLESETAARAGTVELAKLDIDANPAVAGEYGIMSIPAVKAFRNGHVVKEFVGAIPPDAVGAFLDELTGPSAADALLEGEAAAEAVAAGDYERALDLLLTELESGRPGAPRADPCADGGALRRARPGPPAQPCATAGLSRPPCTSGRAAASAVVARRSRAGCSAAPAGVVAATPAQ